MGWVNFKLPTNGRLTIDWCKYGELADDYFEF